MGARGGTTGVSRKSAAHPATPDGRYFVVRGRLWRLANPALDEDVRAALVSDLMQARRAVRDARKTAMYRPSVKPRRRWTLPNADLASVALSGGPTAHLTITAIWRAIRPMLTGLPLLTDGLCAPACRPA